MEPGGWFEFSPNYSEFTCLEAVPANCFPFRFCIFWMLSSRMWYSLVIRAGIFDMCSDSYKYICQTILAGVSLQIYWFLSCPLCEAFISAVYLQSQREHHIFSTCFKCFSSATFSVTY